MGDKLPLPRGLYALLDDSLLPLERLAEASAAVARAGCRVLQLRLERTADRPALALVRQVVEAVGSRALVIVNDRVDLALLGGAHGAHLGEEDLPLPMARKLAPHLLLGATCRTEADVRRAKDQGADYAGVGPVFTTSTKVVQAALLGLDGLREICAANVLPVVAIAGIDLPRIADVARAGAHGAAVGSDLLVGGAIEARARALVEAFGPGASK